MEGESTRARATSSNTKQLFHLGSGAHMGSFIKPAMCQPSPYSPGCRFPLTFTSQIYFASKFTVEGDGWMCCTTASPDTDASLF